MILLFNIIFLFINWGMHKIHADDPNFPVFQGPPLPLWPTFQKRLKKYKSYLCCPYGGSMAKFPVVSL